MRDCEVTNIIPLAKTKKQQDRQIKGLLQKMILRAKKSEKGSQKGSQKAKKKASSQKAKKKASSQKASKGGFSAFLGSNGTPPLL